MLEEPHDRRYPRFARRVQAAIIDGFLLSTAFVSAAIFVSNVDLPTYARISIVTFVILFLEPGLVAFKGSTIGHYVRGLKVEDATNLEKISLFRAIFRFFVKTILGWASLILIFFTKRHQALHDIVSGSVVVLRNPEIYSDEDALLERPGENPDYSYPSKIRRIFVIILYILLFNFVATILMNVSVSPECLYDESCTRMEIIYILLLGIVTIAGSLILLVRGWSYGLWGVRRKKLAVSNNSS